MNDRKNGMDDKKFSLYCSIAIFSISILLFTILTSEVNNIVINNTARKMSFYSNVLDHGISTLSVNSNKTETSDKYSFTDNILNLCGWKNKNSLSVIGKEISYFKQADNDVTTENASKKVARDPENTFDKFSLNEDQVFEEKNKPQNNNTGKKQPAYDPKLKKTLPSKPEVLIYHTHTCESYKPNAINTKDKTQNVCAVGEEIKKELEKNYGISVLHDTTVHDATAYAKSYDRSSVTLKKYLNKYKDFKMIIDLHRDSVENKNAVTATLNNEKVAKFMFVMSKKNPHFNENMKIVNGITSKANKLYPGYCKGTFYYNYGTKFFNQALSNNAVLIEMGSHVNTVTEAKNSAKYLARLIAEYLNGKN